MDAPRVSAALRPQVVMMMMMMMMMINGYKPVVIVHGILDGPKQFQTLSSFIEASCIVEAGKVEPEAPPLFNEHRGTEVIVISLYNNLDSLKPLWMQVRDFRKVLMSIMVQNPDGIHLLCFSQGGVICRALLSTTPYHNVETFIALSSPLAGQYGDTDYLKRVFPDCIKRTLYLLCYNSIGQEVSVCNYWNDPHHRLQYLKHNTFLPLINGEIPHKFMSAWRESFLRIKKMVLIGGPDDGVITPWQSSHFGFYDSKEDVVEMRNQKFYERDTFGLKTLDDRGGVEVCVLSGVKHTEWHQNLKVFQTCMEEWLT